jgi:mono/diheme cytochrome c family protein
VSPPSARRSAPIAVLALAVAGAACDDQIKYVPIFSTMTEQPSIEAYERAALTPPAGAVALGSERSYTLAEADSLSSPLAPEAVDLALGEQSFLTFCSVCHGTDARGRGPVVGPNRIPDIPTLNLHSDQARGYSDGYIWGMITNGRGLMPSYRRIPVEERWQVVAYVRALQAGLVEPVEPDAGTAAGGGSEGSDGGAVGSTP